MMYKPIPTSNIADNLIDTYPEYSFLQTWMAYLPDDIDIADISIPGSHETLAYSRWGLDMIYDHDKSFKE